MADFFTSLSGFIALLVSCCVFYRTIVEAKRIAAIEKRLENLIETNHGEYAATNEIVMLLKKLHSISSGMKAYIDLKELGYTPSDELFNEIDNDFELAEKHFSELALLSPYPQRRKDAANNLANQNGDLDSYLLLRDVLSGRIGVKDSELDAYLPIFEKRLGMKQPRRSLRAYDIRTDGGAF